MSKASPRARRRAAHGDGDTVHDNVHNGYDGAVDDAGAAKARHLARLKRIEGQVRGLHKMVDDERPCAEVLAQIRSVESALRSVEIELVKQHLHRCAADVLAPDDVDARTRKGTRRADKTARIEAGLGELIQLLARR